MLIKVTAEHLLDPHKDNKPFVERALNCPIALALKDSTGMEVFVAPTQLWVEGVAFELPYDLCLTIRSIDRHETVQPFEFEVSDDFIAKAKSALEAKTNNVKSSAYNHKIGVEDN